MKDLHGSASASVAAGMSRCVAFLADVEAYPRWYPDVVRAIEVLARARGGEAERVRATLRAAVGPINRDLDLVLTVTQSPSSVTLTRVKHEASDPERFEVIWRARPDGGSGSVLELALEARLDVPRLVPLRGVGDGIAQGFVQAAARELDRG